MSSPFVVSSSAVGGEHVLGAVVAFSGGWPAAEPLGFPDKQRAPMPMIAGPREDRIMSMQSRRKG